MSSEDLQELSWRDLDKGRFYVNQFSVFMGIRAILFPSNVIKTHMQVSSEASSRNIGSVVSSIVRQNGISGLWRGFWMVAIGIVPSQMLYITTYEIIKERLGELDTSLPFRAFCAGGVASLSSQIVMVPVDVIAQSMMLQTKKCRKSSFATGRDIVTRQGIRHLYKGFGASVCVYAPYSAVWWATYNATQTQLFRMRHRSQPDMIGTANLEDLVLQSLGGMIAAVCSVLTTSPFDIVKTRLQTTHSDSSAIKITNNLVANEGICSFWKGASARMLGALPFSVLGILGYEWVKRSSVRETSLLNVETN